jgi:hypothetical protein
MEVRVGWQLKWLGTCDISFIHSRNAWRLAGSKTIACMTIYGVKFFSD